MTGARRARGKDAGDARETLVSWVAEPSGSFAWHRGSAGEGAVQRQGSRGCGTPQLLLLEATGAGSGPASWGRGWVRPGRTELERVESREDEGGCGRLQEPAPGGARAPTARVCPHAPAPSPAASPPGAPAQPSSFLSSAQQDTPSSDPGEPARASRGGGIFPNSDPAPGGPKLCGRERKGGWRAPGESREPQGAGPWLLPQGAALVSGGFDCGPRRQGRRTRVPAAEGGLCLGLGGQGRGRAMAEASGSQKMPKAESPTQPKVLLLPGERSRNGRRALRSPQ